MSYECRHVIVVSGECVDCGALDEPPHDAEKWKNAGEGECAGCGRRVKNTFSKGRGKACLACLEGAWAGSKP